MTTERDKLIDTIHYALGMFGFSRTDVGDALDKMDAMMEDIASTISDGDDPEAVMEKHHADLAAGAQALANPFVRFPNRTGSEMEELFEVPFMDILNEHGVYLLLDAEFNSVLDFALTDAATPSEFIATIDDLYFSKRDETPVFVSQLTADVMSLAKEHDLNEDGSFPTDVPHENIFSENFMESDEDVAVDEDDEEDEEDEVRIVMNGFSNGGDMTTVLRELNRILESTPAGSVEITAVVKPYLGLNDAMVEDMFATIKDKVG